MTNLDHNIRLQFARDTLEGLSVGDALGEGLSYQCSRVRDLSDFSMLAQGSVRFTDNTAMALGIVECPGLCRIIDQDSLAWTFVKNFKADPEREYGKMTRRLLTQLSEGGSWRTLSASAFAEGSFGNGSAMRVGPLGAYFSDDLQKVCQMAAASAQVTHSHPEGIAGAIAVAVATAKATTSRQVVPEQASQAIWEAVIALTPEGSTTRGLKLARSFDPNRAPSEVAKVVVCGYDVSCQDTVPFGVWNACRCLHDFRESLLSTVEVGGDCDTNAAIVCGIVSSYRTSAYIPNDWRAARESLPLKLSL